MKARTLAVVVMAGVVLCQYAPPTFYYNRTANGGIIITQPGAVPYQAPTFINPLAGGGFAITQPGAVPYQPPAYAFPLGNGGYVTTLPGVGVLIAPSRNAQENR